MFENIKNVVIFMVATLILTFASIHILSAVSSCEKSASAADVDLTGHQKSWDNAWEDKVEPDKFKSVAEGVYDGKGWCLNPKNKCYNGVRNRLKTRYSDYKEWFEDYASGMVPVHVALTSTTEAPAGPEQCSPDAKLRECGILGIKMMDAKECDINVCSPEASIWCFSYLATKRRMAAVKIYENLYMAPNYDQYVIGGISGGIGQLAKYIVDKSGALDVVGTDGSTKLKYDSPYKRILTWLSHYSSKKPKTMMDLIFSGRITDYKVGLRVARFHAVMEIVREFYGVETVDDIPYRKLLLTERPQHLPGYPGEALHGKCKKFSEMLGERP